MSDDPRFTGYWAAIRADLSKQTVDAVIRLADNEQADLRAEVERLNGLLNTMDHFADVAETCERKANESHARREAAEAEVEGLRAALRFKDGAVEDIAVDLVAAWDTIERLRHENCGCVS